jgi:FkbM family methyltransferase
MGWKYSIGSGINGALDALMSSPIFPLTKYFPRGYNWMYDAQRFAATRHFDTIFDVGANIGQTTKGLIRYFPNANIYCFEPVAASFAKLRKNYCLNANVHPIQKALGSESGQISIALHNDSELNTLVTNSRRMEDLSGETETVQVMTIDQFCRNADLAHIDLLKIDVQGWEVSVLSGASSMLSRNKVHFVLSEVAFRRADADMQHVGELSDFMESNGFWLCGFYDPFRWGKNKQFFGFTNALYLNQNFNP